MSALLASEINYTGKTPLEEPNLRLVEDDLGMTAESPATEVSDTAIPEISIVTRRSFVIGLASSLTLIGAREASAGPPKGVSSKMPDQRREEEAARVKAEIKAQVEAKAKAEEDARIKAEERKRAATISKSEAKARARAKVRIQAEVDARKEVEKYPERVAIGVFTFNFSPGFTEYEKKEIVDVFRLAYRYLERNFISMDGVKHQSINVVRDLNGKTNFVQGNKLSLLEDYSGVLVHELAHLMIGDRDPMLHFLTEGLPEFLGSAAGQNGIGSGHLLRNVALSKNLQDSDTKLGGIYLNPKIDFEKYKPLEFMRYDYSGRYWKDLEDASPGFIKEFIDRYIAALDDLGRRASSKRVKRRITNKLLAEMIAEKGITEDRKVREKPKGMKMKSGKMIYASYYEYANSPREGNLEIYLVKKNGRTGLERGLGKRKITYKIEMKDIYDPDPRYYSVGDETEVYTDNDGTFELSLRKGNYSPWKPGNYKITVTCPSLKLKEELEFRL